MRVLTSVLRKLGFDHVQFSPLAVQSLGGVQKAKSSVVSRPLSITRREVGPTVAGCVPKDQSILPCIEATQIEPALNLAARRFGKHPAGTSAHCGSGASREDHRHVTRAAIRCSCSPVDDATGKC